MAEEIKVQQERATSGVLASLLDAELTVSQHYWTRAVAWRNAGYPRLAAYYEKEADEERGHARMIADRMAFLNPTAVEPGPEREKAMSVGAIDEDLAEDLRGEVEVANSYPPAMRTAFEAGDLVTWGILKTILEQTESHVDWLQAEIGKLEAMGEAVYLSTWAGRE